MSNKNALAVRENNTAVASMADIMATDNMWERICAMGKTLAQSGFLGEKVSEAGAVAAAMTMVSEGLNPVEFKRRYHIIGTTPSRTPGSLMGDFQQMGGTWEIVQADDEACEIKFMLGKMSYTSRVTMERMLQTTVPFGKDGTLKSNWANFPDDMLYARCCAKGLRRIAPGLMGGVYTKEEVQDFEQAPSRPVVSENEMRYRAAMQKPAACDNAEPAAKPEAPEIEDAQIVSEPATAPGAADHGADAPVITCPIEGPFFGLPFSEIDTDILQYMVDPVTIEKHPEMTPDIVSSVKSIVEQRIKEAEVAE